MTIDITTPNNITAHTITATTHTTIIIWTTLEVCVLAKNIFTYSITKKPYIFARTKKQIFLFCRFLSKLWHKFKFIIQGYILFVLLLTKYHSVSLNIKLMRVWNFDERKICKSLGFITALNLSLSGWWRTKIGLKIRKTSHSLIINFNSLNFLLKIQTPTLIDLLLNWYRMVKIFVARTKQSFFQVTATIIQTQDIMK
jgi:hypothetical protein